MEIENFQQYNALNERNQSPKCYIFLDSPLNLPFVAGNENTIFRGAADKYL